MDVRESGAGSTTKLRLTVDRQSHELDARSASDPLLTTLRDALGLTGTKYSCLEGICGACTVLVEGEPIRSCITPTGDSTRFSRPSSMSSASNAASAHRVRCSMPRDCWRAIRNRTMSRSARRWTEMSVDAAHTPRILRSVKRAAELIRSDEATKPLPVDAVPGPTSAVDDWLPRPTRPWDHQDPTARDYFDVLGDGLVVVLPPDEVDRPNRAG